MSTFWATSLFFLGTSTFTHNRLPLLCQTKLPDTWRIAAPLPRSWVPARRRGTALGRRWDARPARVAVLHEGAFVGVGIPFVARGPTAGLDAIRILISGTSEAAVAEALRSHSYVGRSPSPPVAEQRLECAEGNGRRKHSHTYDRSFSFQVARTRTEPSWM
jgi:hypothetical protein